MPRRLSAVEVMARLVASADFERVLRARSRASTSHFALHHLPVSDASHAEPMAGSGATHLSTDLMEAGERLVDNKPVDAPRQLGAVVPKRHARRAVTRSLLKRQIYAAGHRHVAALPRGLWIVRLRAPFDRGRYVSAASIALRDDARAELDALFGAASRVAAS